MVGVGADPGRWRRRHGERDAESRQQLVKRPAFDSRVQIDTGDLQQIPDGPVNGCTELFVA